MLKIFASGLTLLNSAAPKAARFGSVTGVALLGVIQGLTEFLPVSSSGHLVIGQKVLGLISEPDLLLDVLLHVGTLLPVLWLYRRDIGQMLLSLGKLGRPVEAYRDDPGFRLTVCVLIGTLPTGVIGLLLKDTFERLFSSLLAVAIALMGTGGILMLTRLRREADAETPHRTLDAKKALIVGIAQGCAITPGISRSGSTIATALLLGVERELAAKLSFVMSIPAIMGAVLLSLKNASFGQGKLATMALGALVASVSGYIALRWVVRVVRRGEMHWFSYYVWPLGFALLLYATLR